jgi:hypothetical protein
LPVLFPNATFEEAFLFTETGETHGSQH